MVSLADIGAGLASVQVGFEHTQIDTDRVCTCLDMLVAHAVSPLLLSPLTLEILENVKEVVSWHPQLALPGCPDQNMWSYCGLLWINPIVFDDHLAIILVMIKTYVICIHNDVSCV